jgi:hypothetical protein
MKSTSIILGLAFFGNAALTIASGVAQVDSNLAARVYNEDLGAAARHHARSKRSEGLSAASHGQQLRRIAENEKAQRRILRKKSCVAQTSSGAAAAATPTATATNASAVDPVVDPVVTGTNSSSTLVNQVAAVTASGAASTASTSTAAAAAATSAAASGSSSSSITVDPAGAGPFSGQGTYYELGTTGTSLGSCGTSLVDSDAIAAVSHLLYDSWPGYAGVNPNLNPICGKKAKVNYGGKSVVVSIEDRCTGCAERDIDLSPSMFSDIADMGLGRIDITWEWVQ